MRKYIAIVFLSLMLSGCADPKVIDGIKYDTYGILNADEKKNPNIEYRMVWGNLVWSLILCETIIAPFYFIGFSMYEPIGKLDPNKPKGAI